MRKLTIRDDEYATLWYYPDRKVVHHQIHKFIPAGIFQDILSAGAECIEKHHATKWLSDDRNNTVVRNEDVEWGRTVWAPRVVRAGFKYWALVPPQRAIGQMQMSGIIEDYARMGVTIKTFANDVQAMEWLASVDRAPRS